MSEFKTLKTQDLLNYFYKPDVGAATFAMNRMARLVQAQVPPPPDWVRDRIPTTQALLTEAAKIRYDWDNRKKMEPLRREGAMKADARVDRALSSLFDMAAAYKELDPASSTYQLADELIEDAFPDGVWPITSVRYELEHTKVNELLERLRGPLAPNVAELNLTLMVDRLESLNAEYGERLSSAGNKAVAFSDVEAAERQAIEAYFEVILVIWTAYLDAPTTRTKLLAPAAEQNERIAEYYKKRNTRPTVDPQTGEVIEPGEHAPEDVTTDTDPADEPVIEPVISDV